MSTRLNCPVCNQQDQVEKVSTLYLIGIGLKGQSAGPTYQPGQSKPGSQVLQELSESELRALSRRLAPPASKKEAMMRPLHPDLMVLTFSLVIPIFLFGIFQDQSPMLLPALIVLGFFYVFYAWKRKSFVDKFELQLKKRQASQQQIRIGIDRWMKLYYCARDDGVFEPGAQQLVPSDDLMSFLMKNDYPGK
jgi:hypothetical protein